MAAVLFGFGSAENHFLTKFLTAANFSDDSNSASLGAVFPAPIFATVAARIVERGAACNGGSLDGRSECAVSKNYVFNRRENNFQIQPDTLRADVLQVPG